MRTDEELRDAAFLALRDALGSADALRFMRFYRPEPGDFTQEKYLHLGDPSLDELITRIERRHSERPLVSNGRGAPARGDDEVREIAYAALRGALGTEDSLRFIRLYTGSDDDDPTVFSGGSAAGGPVETTRRKAVGQEQAA